MHFLGNFQNMEQGREWKGLNRVTKTSIENCWTCRLFLTVTMVLWSTLFEDIMRTIKTILVALDQGSPYFSAQGPHQLLNSSRGALIQLRSKYKEIGQQCCFNYLFKNIFYSVTI